MSKSHVGEILRVVYRGALSNRIEPNNIGRFMDGLADIFEKIPTQDRVKALNSMGGENPDMEFVQQLVDNATNNKIDATRLVLFMVPFVSTVNGLPKKSSGECARSKNSKNNRRQSQTQTVICRGFRRKIRSEKRSTEL